MRILLLSTSPRTGSLTLRFTKYLQSQLQNKEDIESVEIVSFENFDFPSVGRQKLDYNTLSDYQKNLISKWQEAHLVIFCNPEYNWTTNGEVFTMLDQIGNKFFAHLFDNKAFAFVGTSSGRGGRLPALEVSKVVSKVISFQNRLSIISPKIFEAHEIAKNLNENGDSVGNPVFESGLAEFIQYTLAVARRWVILEKFV